MSRGRGRGRGGGGAGRGGGMAFTGLQSEIQGVSLFPTEPVATFPEIALPIPRKLTTEEEAILQHQDKMLTILHDSAFYLTAPPPPKDIERYSDKYLVTSQQRPKLRSVRTDLNFFPDELHRILDPAKKGNVQRKVDLDLAATFERIERQALDEDKEGDEGDEAKEGGDVRQGRRDGDEDEDDGVVDAEYEDEDDDYDAQQYFDNGEGDEGGDDEDLDGGTF
ncbi:DNA-directed RNA polymerase III, subunit Rpc31 [Syncephalis pseudoplumigaleata]|uniref:DNA-directed RNA polymerase III subunit n=1 Tax=Syncephalis pseudoplumigaleata TaxID=1712513 RepID=A0A4P9Z0Z4_9FUNG|nr:DNA-directed RNA polymerase III, subunit Rpc31 [Syncephalis pseudoplumigaleata]|eukprot:RKP25381.1 DNA-directed RNA polymerase III, subunit Rpc31 [Syncephalis pseudoplumigaleata]